MGKAQGHLTVVQESRFVLATEDGRGLRLTLGRQANLDAADLCDLLARGVRVTVEYDGEPGLASGVARRVDAHDDRAR